MRYLKSILFGCLVLMAIGAEAKETEQIKVVPVAEDDDAANGGVIYTLPQTELEITIEAKLTVKKVGPFYKYSNKYLNIQDVVLADGKKWEIVGAKIKTKGVENPALRYKITAQNADMPSVYMNGNGIVKQLGGDEDGRLPKGERRGVKKEKKWVDVDEIDDIELDFDDVQLDQATLTKTSTAAMAEAAAQMIYKIREKRLALLGGEESTLLSDAGSYDKVLSELNRQEHKLLQLFVGKSKVVYVKKSFKLVPGAKSEESMVLVRFAENKGFMDAMDVQGKPVYVDFKSVQAGTRLKEYAEQSKQRKAKPISGIRYIIPAVTNVRVLDRNNLLVEQNVEVAQGGQIATLPIEMLANGYTVRFDTTTGNVKSIKQPKSKPEIKTKK